MYVTSHRTAHLVPVFLAYPPRLEIPDKVSEERNKEEMS